MTKLRRSCNICYERKLKCEYNAKLAKCKRCLQSDAPCEFGQIKQRASKQEDLRKRYCGDNAKQSTVWIPHCREMVDQILYMKSQLGDPNLDLEELPNIVAKAINYFGTMVNIVCEPETFEKDINSSDIMLLLAFGTQIVETINLALRKVKGQLVAITVVTNFEQQIPELIAKFDFTRDNWPTQTRECMVREFVQMLRNWVQKLQNRCESYLQMEPESFELPGLDFSDFIYAGHLVGTNN